MAVNETLSGYSITAASNTPAGTDNVGPDLDNHLRDIKKNIRIAFEHSNSEAVRGRIWNDTSASPVTTLKYSDGTDDISLFNIDESANTVTPFVGSVVMGTAPKVFNAAEGTASALDVLTFSAATKHLASASTTATIHQRIGVGTAIGDLPENITGSATSGAALPALSAEFLTNFPNAFIQQAHGTLTAVQDITTKIPVDDTIPQNTEGTEILTQAITPTDTNNILFIEVVIANIWRGTSATALVAALFQDTTADALAASISTAQGSNAPCGDIKFSFQMTAGTTSETTFKIRVGRSDTNGATLHMFVNASAASATRAFGGVSPTTLTITEFKP